jgi:hypothetical protein
MNVLATATSHPMAKTDQISAAQGCVLTRQTSAGSGCHSQNSAMSARLAASTYVLRSAVTGSSLARRRLNPVLAITEC